MKNILIFFPALLCMVSCNDFLNKQPVTELRSDIFWKNESDANAGIVSIYYSFSLAMSNGYYDWGELRGGNWTPYDKGSVPQQEMINHAMPSTNTAGRWTDLYQAINRANLAIKYIPDISMPPAAKNTYLGEAYAMRALCYFYAVRVWGDAPLIITPMEKWDAVTGYASRSPREELLVQIESDLLKAEQLLPRITSGTPNRKRMTKAAVYAAMMDFYAWRHEWHKVISVMEEKVNLLGSSLWGLDPQITPSLTQAQFTEAWRGLFMNCETTDCSREIFFALAYEYQENGTNRSITYLAAGNSLVRASEELKGVYSPYDKRVDATFRTGWGVNKYWPDGTAFSGSNSVRSDNGLVMYRYADIVLLYAEALNRDFRTVDAIAQLNRIRTRAGVPEAKPTDYVDNDELAMDILKERRVELLCEGKYWFDLIRNGQQAAMGKCTNPLMELFPVYIDHILQNPNIKQNEGYN